MDHLAFHVEDVAALVQAARAEGVKIAKEPYHLPGSASKPANLPDPNGLWVVLIELAD